MNNTIDNQNRLAKILWQADFSKESVRNWRMAELLLANAGFHALLDSGRPPQPSAYPLNHGGQYTPADAYNQPMAYKIYELSFGLDYPSLDMFKNWITGLYVWDIHKSL